MSPAFLAIIWTQKLAAVAIFLQTLEFFRIQKSFSDSGVWQWRILRKDWVSSPKSFQKILDRILSASFFGKILWLRLAASILMLFVLNPVVVFLALLTTVLICLRWRGVFNGGSDYMTVVVLTGLLLLSVFPNSVQAGLAYISLQASLSYFLAGIAKVRYQGWRNGKSLQQMLKNYGISQSLPMTRAASWSVMIFELSFPLVFIDSGIAMVYIVTGALFHLANFFLFGLNRFFWAWLATYPALYYCSTHFL